MFYPNRVGFLASRTGYDVFARPSFSPEMEVPFASVTLKEIAQKTSVRADSSASRGSADEVYSKVKILMPAYVNAYIGDTFRQDLSKYAISAKHPRYSVFGTLDHFEYDLEIVPE
ncbi:MAG: hypothetical protein ACEQSB_00300 [Undibacterium sp.]